MEKQSIKENALKIEIYKSMFLTINNLKYMIVFKTNKKGCYKSFQQLKNDSYMLIESRLLNFERSKDKKKTMQNCVKMCLGWIVNVLILKVPK